MGKGFDREKIESHYFCRISKFFVMGLQIFLYQGLAGLHLDIPVVTLVTGGPYKWHVHLCPGLKAYN